jgi:hypothetical protein
LLLLLLQRTSHVWWLACNRVQLLLLRWQHCISSSATLRVVYGQRQLLAPGINHISSCPV